MSHHRSSTPWGAIAVLVIIAAVLVVLAVWYGYYRCDLGNPTYPNPWWGPSCPMPLP